MRRTPKSFSDARTCSRSSITMPSLVGLGFHPPPGQPKTLSFFVFLFVTLLNIKDCAPDFAMKAWEYINDFDTVGYGKVCSSVPMFNCLRLLPIGDTTKCRSPKNGKNWGFPQPQDDGINRSRQNFAGRRVPWACYRSPNLALLGKRRSVQEPPKMSKFAQNCGFWPLEADTMNTFR